MKKLILLLLAASPVMAHHGRGSTYDMKKELSRFRDPAAFGNKK